MENQSRKSINLNRASQVDLETLPGIGPELAREIVADREQRGSFKEVSDIIRVKGIGEKLYEQIREFIYVAEEKNGNQVEPIVFRGEASNLKGVIPIVNRADRRIKRARLRVENCDLQTLRGEPLTEIVVRQRLQPGQHGEAVVSIAVPDSTPPGIHEGALVIGDEHRPVIFHIAERLGVDVVPRELFIDNIPGSKVKKTVFVTNTGNVPIIFNDIGAVGIEETGIVNRAIRNTVGQHKGGGIDAAFEVFTGQLKEAFTRSRILSVRTKNKPVEIPPGETRSLDLEISLPESMPTRYGYTGKIQLYNSRIRLEIPERNNNQTAR